MRERVSETSARNAPARATHACAGVIRAGTARLCGVERAQKTRY